MTLQENAFTVIFEFLLYRKSLALVLITLQIRHVIYDNIV